MSENVAFAVSCNNLYVNCLTALLKSIRINQPDFDYDFWVIDSGLSDANIKKLNDIYPIAIKQCNEVLYMENMKDNPKYRSIEMFRIDGYDKVIQLGADCILLNRVDDLVKESCDIGMPKEKLRANMYSSGIMVIGEKYLNSKTYHQLMKADFRHIDMFGTDMKLYNCFFKGQIKELSYYYNVMVSEEHLPEYDESKIVFLHYCHKPQATRNKISKRLYELWDSYFHAKVEPYGKKS